MLLNIRQLMDDAKCYEVVRELRWPDGVKCPACDSGQINKRGSQDHQAHRQRYSCQECGRQFDDLSGTVFEGHRQGLKTWILCLYLMGLNLSNRQIAAELDLNEDDVQVMASQLREGVMAKKKPVKSNVMRYTLSPDIKVVPMWWRSWVGWGDADGSKVPLGVARWPVKSRLSWA